MKILSAIVLAVAVVGSGSSADARASHHRQHMMHRDSHTGATTTGSGGGVGTNGATQTGVNSSAGSGGAAGGMGR